MKRYIVGMSVNKKDIQRKLFDVSLPLTEHLAKLYLFPTSDNVNHWRGEVYSFLHIVPKLRHNKKFPDARFIFNEISAYADTCDSMMKAVESMESSESVVRSDSKELEEMLTKYFRWIASELSSNGAVTTYAVYSELDQLGF